MVNAARAVLFTGVIVGASLDGRGADVVTDPVGFITLNITGTGGVVSSANTFLGLSMTPIVKSQGKITSFGPSTITDSGASWADDQFNGANGPHFIEITSGTYAGTMEDIVDTVGATKTITTANNLQSHLVGGETYRIRKHWTVAAIFGAANEAGLGGGSSSAVADNILVPVGTSFSAYYYKTTLVPGGIGWRKSTDAFTDASNTSIFIDQGIVIKRRQSSALSLKLVGAVKLGQTITPIELGNNFLGNVYAANLTLGASGLYTGNATTGLTGGSSAATADNVLIPNGASFDAYYYKTTVVPGGTGWRKSTDAFADASATPIPIGNSAVIQRKSGGAFDWKSQPPY